jgi:uncharacterized Tic20 family protein
MDKMSEVREVPNTENRLLAALAHGSVVMQGLGLLVGVLVYVTQREKSRYAAFQALQAAVYQLVNMILIGVMWAIWGVAYAGMLSTMFSLPRNAQPPTSFFIVLGATGIPLVFMLAVDIFGLLGALRTWQGREFRYPLLGGWLDRSGLWNGK